MGRPGWAGAAGFFGAEGFVARGRYDQKKPFMRAAMDRVASGGGIDMDMSASNSVDIGASDSARCSIAGDCGGRDTPRCSGAGTDALRYPTGWVCDCEGASCLEIAMASSSR